MKRITLVWIAALVIFLTGCSTVDHSTSFSDGGSFSGSASGYENLLTVDVLVKNGAIIKIRTNGVNEAYSLAVDASNQISHAIVSNQSLQVDSISGATITSSALLSAVEMAVSSSGVDLSYFYSDISTRVQETKNQEDRYDLVIIGGGAAGLAASVEASLQGKSVVLIEKLPFVGGNTALSGGEMSVPQSDLQSKHEIHDQVELMAQDMIKGGRYIGNEALVQVLCQNINHTVQWLEKKVGVEFQDRVYQVSGHSKPRTIIPIGLGAGIIEHLLVLAEERGVQVLYNARATDLIVDPSGKVSGVIISRGGEQLSIYATERTILATGGFSANIEMRQVFNTQWRSLGGEVLTSNSPGITGDGIQLAKAVGADLLDMEYIQLYPYNNPASGKHYYLDNIRTRGGAFFVNQEGERFVNEDEVRDVVAGKILEQTAQTSYEVFTQSVIDLLSDDPVAMEEVDRWLEQGVLIKRDSLEECAVYFGVNRSVILDTLRQYNEFIFSGVDLEFGRTMGFDPLLEGPFYMLEGVPSVHYTMGGVSINESAEVLNTEGDVIPGLYAAGEVTGGIHGANRLGACAVPDALVFGRIAGGYIPQERVSNGSFK